MHRRRQRGRPEDVRGAPGYEEFLEALEDPSNPQHERDAVAQRVAERAMSLTQTLALRAGGVTRKLQLEQPIMLPDFISALDPPPAVASSPGVSMRALTRWNSAPTCPSVALRREHTQQSRFSAKSR